MEETITKPRRTFGSVGVAMVTPFFEDGSLDIDTAVSLAVSLVDQGCDSLVLSGTTGEAPTTHQPEKDDLVREVKKAVGSRALIIAGAGSNDTAHAVRMARSAQACGADGLLVVSPYYSRPSQEGIYQHMCAIADSTDLPVLLYDIPGRTGVSIELDTFKRLNEHPLIKGVKDATGNIGAACITMRETDLEFYSGDDVLNLPWLMSGAVGVISVTGHVNAPALRALVEAIDEGDIHKARDIFYQQIPINNAIMGGGQGAVMAKEALKLIGVIPSATLRLPLVGASRSQLIALVDVLRSEGLM
ncbi:MAG: 4-hydroxy-tetrahydrodipicolinate synthase [Actinomycetaceae bacterium]|nr:4-hydroxy-tetrahydrodipicolinate synthase [Actinomycetaceae bacterium]